MNVKAAVLERYQSGIRAVSACCDSDVTQIERQMRQLLANSAGNGQNGQLILQWHSYSYTLHILKITRMAIQTSPLFTGFRGSVNRHLLFRQCGGKTILSRFPDRSKVLYSLRQKMAQKRFSDAVEFARVVIKEPGLKEIYSVKASLLGFRSSWNMAIAEFMSDKPLTVKKKKIRFDKSILARSLRWNIPVKLYRYEEEPAQNLVELPPRNNSGRINKRLLGLHPRLPEINRTLKRTRNTFPQI